MNNNDIFKKLRVALMLRDDQIEEVLNLVDFRMSKAEIGNFFRNADHPKYVECGDQVLRNFLNGLVIYLRGPKDNPKNPMEIIAKNKIQVQSVETKKPLKPIDKKPLLTASNNFKKKKPILNKPKPIVEKVTFKNGKK
jgi:hypothetical protein